MKQKIREKLRRKKDEPASDAAQSGEGVPRITNETVAAHREEVLSSARKYIYPLQHSKHRVVLISSGLFITAVVAFFAYCVLGLYQFGSTSTFIYRMTQIVPFPVARIGGKFVAYENYLFELRHYTHYYESQLKVDFKNKDDKAQLDSFKQQALDKVLNDAYIKELAEKYKVSVSEREVDDRITIVRNQNRLGDSDKVFEDVLKDYWGWSVDDFRRSLREQLLAEKLVSVLDTDAHNKADAAFEELKNGADFTATAKKYSDDPSKEAGGEYGFPVDKTNRDIPAQVTEALFALQPGQFSQVVNTGYSLEIVKNIEATDGKLRAAHIVINFKGVTNYLNDIKDQQKARVYIKAK